MKTIIVNIDGSAMKFSKSNYIKYIKDSIKGKTMPFDCYNAKYLGGIRYTEDLNNELKIMLERN